MTTEHPVPQPPQHHLVPGTEAHHNGAAPDGPQHHEQYDDERFANSPGRNAPFATLEIDDPRSIGQVHCAYEPKHDGQPDPGEIVWTWVPYEEHDGRGKDRPVLLVAREKGSQTLLAVKLTSKGWKHEDDRENWVDVGNGHWDREARESWAVIDKVVRVHHDGIRRVSCELERHHFDEVIKRLDRRYSWL